MDSKIAYCIRKTSRKTQNTFSQSITTLIMQNWMIESLISQSEFAPFPFNLQFIFFLRITQKNSCKTRKLRTTFTSLPKKRMYLKLARPHRNRSIDRPPSGEVDVTRFENEEMEREETLEVLTVAACWRSRARRGDSFS